MALRKATGIALLVAGALGLIYGSFTHTRDTHKVGADPSRITAEEQKYVTVPLWAGFGSVLLSVMLLLPGRKFGA